MDRVGPRVGDAVRAADLVSPGRAVRRASTSFRIPAGIGAAVVTRERPPSLGSGRGGLQRGQVHAQHREGLAGEVSHHR